MEVTGRSSLDKCLEEGGEWRMKFEKLLHPDVLTGVVLGTLIGLHYDLVGIKTILVFLGVIMGLKLVTSK